MTHKGPVVRGTEDPVGSCLGGPIESRTGVPYVLHKGGPLVTSHTWQPQGVLQMLTVDLTCSVPEALPFMGGSGRALAGRSAKWSSAKPQIKHRASNDHDTF